MSRSLRTLFVIVALFSAGVAPYAQDTTTTTGPTPVVAWIAPANNSTFPAYATITLQATASEAGGAISQVFFYTGAGKIVCSAVTAPYACQWTSVPPGAYTVRALAIDAKTKGASTAIVNITVSSSTSGGGPTPPPPPPPPALYTLTVTSGSGSGSYAANAHVPITASAPPAGEAFSKWIGSAAVADASASATVVTMAASNAGITATYFTPPPVPQPVTTHPRLWLTVNDVPKLQQWATLNNPVYKNGMQPVLANAVHAYQTQFFPNGVANPNYPDPGDTQGYQGLLTEEYGLILAFNSLVDQSAVARAQYAQEARNMLMYAMNLAALGHASGLPFRDPMFMVYNRGNGSGEEWPLVVDWIYNATDINGVPLLTPADKLTIRNVFLMWANDCLNAATTGGDHPSPTLVTNNMSLLPGGKAYRMAANNYYLGHSRLLTLMALAIDPVDDPAINAALPASNIGNSLRSFITDATGAWLYQEFAMFGEPQAIATAFNLQNTAGLGMSNGGLPPEGMLYGHSFAYLLGELLALQTAGFNDPALSGPQIGLIGSPVWDRFVKGFLSSLTNQPQVAPGFAYLGPVYQFSSYGDVLRIWTTPDYLDPFALLALLEQQNGQSTHQSAARWLGHDALEGGAANFYKRMTNPYSFSQTVLYFLLFDPSAAPAADPRPGYSTTFLDKSQSRLVARTDWGASASVFDFRSSWNSINHQQNDAGMFSLSRKGEWLTKQISNYDSNGFGQSSFFHNTLALQNTCQCPSGQPTNLQWWEQGEWTTGSQFALGQSAGDPTAMVSTGTGYAYGFTDMTNLYNRPQQWTPQDAAVSITHASRSILWFGTDFIAVYDRATSAAAGLFKRFNMSFVTAPTITPTVNGSIAREVMPSGQQLFVQTLGTFAPTVTVQNGANLVSFVAWMNTTQFIMSVEDPSKPADVRFLHVVQGADAGASMVPATRVQSFSGTAFDGAIVGNTAVFFVTDMKAVFVGTTLSVPTGTTVYVTGLTPNATYQVTTQADPANTTIIVMPSAIGVTADVAGVLKIG
jgi:hypothetical protein